MNYSSSNTLSTLDYIIHVISNYYIKKEEIIYALDYEDKPTYYTLYLSYLFYIGMNLDIFNNSSITIFYTSLCILGRLNL